MRAELVCIRSDCQKRFAITEVLYTCPECGSLLDADYDFSATDAEALRRLWRERRLSAAPLDQSGVWRFREMFPFLDDYGSVVTLREGNTPLLEAPAAARYAGLDALRCKHQGYNPSGSFKDNGTTAGVAQARRLRMRMVACVSTGNTSASMAAYAAAAGLQAVIFLPHGNIAYGKLAQALEYGALTVQVEANFDQILALVRELAAREGIYLLNSVNPFRIEGQKTIMLELLEQCGWQAPDWIVLPGGNLGNTAAFGKALREARQVGLIRRLPRLAVVQAEGAAPFYHLYRDQVSQLTPVENPETLATAIKIGAPVSWPKALREVEASLGIVEQVSEQEIADAKAVLGRCGIGCEPASAATLAGVRKLAAARVIRRDHYVVIILTGHLLKDPDYIYRYHTSQLDDPEGRRLVSTYGNQPVVAPHDPGRIAELLRERLNPPATAPAPEPEASTAEPPTAGPDSPAPGEAPGGGAAPETGPE